MSDSTNALNPSSSHEDFVIQATVLYWWERRRLIGIVLLLSVLFFAAALFVIPKSYRAQAAIIIMPPRFVPEIRTQPLTVITAKSLLQTNELYQQIIINLRRYRRLATKELGSEQPDAEAVSRLVGMTESDLAASGRMSQQDAAALAELDESEIYGLLEFTEKDLSQMTVDAVSRILSSEESVEKKTAAELTFSPVLQLYAVSDSGNKAQILVNLWARLFEAKYESLTRGQTQKLFVSLENQQQAGQEELEKIQKVLVEFRLTNNLELIERQIKDYTESFSAYHKELVANEDKLVGMQAKVKSLEKLLDSLEGPNFSWVGSVEINTETTDSAGNKYLAGVAGKPDTSSSDVIRRRRWEAVQNRQDLIIGLEKAAVFNRENPVELMTAERSRLEKEYMQEKTDYRSSSVEAEVGRKSLAQLNEAISETSQVVILLTGLPDEVLGDVLASGSRSGVNLVTSYHLNKEQLNPLWETLVKQRADVSRSVNEAQSKMAELAAALPEKEAALREMGQKIFSATQGEKLVATAVQRREDRNQSLYADYVKMREEVFATGWEIITLQDEVESLKLALEKSRDQIEELRKSFESASATEEIIELRKKAVTQRAELLTQKLQESMVAVREEVSDVSLASRAVAPTEHYFPPRILLLAVMTLLTTGLLLGGLARKRYRELLAG